MTYYVYELIDPRDGKPFYVGKGKGSRVDVHEKDARRGVYSRKCNRIREIEGTGATIVKSVVKRFKVEDSAYAFEARHIAKLGMENLTNVTEGGRGGPGCVVDPETAADRERVALFVKASVKSKGFAPDMDLGFNYGERFHVLPELFIAKVKQWFYEVVQKRGEKWAQDVALKHGVALAFK